MSRPGDCCADRVRLLFQAVAGRRSFDRVRAAIGVLTIALMGCRTAAPVAPVKTIFHDVQTFSGSSLGGDAEVYAARREGIGQVYGSAETSAHRAELVLRSRPRQDAPVVAYLDYELTGDGGSGVAFKASEPGLHEELTRVSHEDYGLIVDSVRRGWAKVIYGYRLTGEVRFGWVQLVPGQVVFVSYDDQLAHYPYFVAPGRVELFEKPNGRRVEFPLTLKAGGEPNYKLSVLAIETHWIQVALEVPDTDPCGGDPEAKVERSTTVWVRRFDGKGRYQIGYSPAGC